ncbi:hypothetical protein RvY_13641-2 [Ramazzottius varieornatus]|nr:hypothetical protein RvY_13641-2 [Ramazzottius varieornatus]
MHQCPTKQTSRTLLRLLFVLVTFQTRDLPQVKMRGLLFCFLVLAILAVVLEQVNAQFQTAGGGSGDGGLIIMLKSDKASASANLLKFLRK